VTFGGYFKFETGALRLPGLLRPWRRAAPPISQLFTSSRIFRSAQPCRIHELAHLSNLIGENILTILQNLSRDSFQSNNVASPRLDRRRPEWTRLPAALKQLVHGHSKLLMPPAISLPSGVCMRIHLETSFVTESAIWAAESAISESAISESAISESAIWALESAISESAISESAIWALESAITESAISESAITESAITESAIYH
jgi:hypothetical protein